MAVLINYKICDNAKECGGIAVCPTGALSWDEENQTIAIDNEKCISCGKCEPECPIGAIRVAKEESKYQEIKKEIDEDPRTTKDLFVDRYGATPLSEFFMIEPSEIENKVQGNNIVLIETYNDDSIECLLKSIPISKLTQDLPQDTLFYKTAVGENDMNSLGIKELPSLLIYKEGKLINKIEGYYSSDDKDKLIDKIHSCI